MGVDPHREPKGSQRLRTLAAVLLYKGKIVFTGVFLKQVLLPLINL